MKKNRLKSFGIFVVSVFSIALTSCGGSSGGGDAEIDFEQKDLVNKYWYYNGFINSTYDASDVLLVYKFQGNNFETKGTLVKQQYSGRLDEQNAGTWQFVDDKLTIIDNTIDGSPVQEWYLRAGSTGTNLKLRGAGDLGGDRDFFSEISGLNDVTADAFYVKVKKSDGSIENHISYEVVGKDLEKVVAMPNKESSHELMRFEELVHIDGTDKEKVVFRLKETDIEVLNEMTDVNVKFYIELPNGLKLKLDEDLPKEDINSLEYFRSFDPETHVVKWKANLGEGVFYRVEVLDENKEVIFRSLRQPDNSKGELALLEVKANINNLEHLKTEDAIFIRISAFKYEKGIDPINSTFMDANIQVKSIYTYSGNW